MKPVLGTDPNFLETLVEINHDITSTLDLDQLLRKIAALTNRVIPYQIFAIFLVDEAKRDLYYRFGIGHEQKIAGLMPGKLDGSVVGALADVERTCAQQETRGQLAIHTPSLDRIACSIEYFNQTPREQ